MKEIELSTIKELAKKINSGELNPDRLTILLDNDRTNFYYGDEETDSDAVKYVIAETNGYQDIEPLYKLVFPMSTVEWC